MITLTRRRRAIATACAAVALAGGGLAAGVAIGDANRPADPGWGGQYSHDWDSSRLTRSDVGVTSGRRVTYDIAIAGVTVGRKITVEAWAESQKDPQTGQITKILPQLTKRVGVQDFDVAMTASDAFHLLTTSSAIELEFSAQVTPGTSRWGYGAVQIRDDRGKVLLETDPGGNAVVADGE